METKESSNNIQYSSNGDGTLPQQKQKRAPRKTVGIPSVTALSSMNSLYYSAHVVKDPVPWDSIQLYQLYSPAPDGSRLMIKLHKSKSVDLKTLRTVPTAYGQAYPVDLNPNPVDPKTMAGF
ncbi:hypothetical protein NIES4071_109870 (plasmid) [Calothrix sp. NIES-4071]|nr:hypothetical protein NIES4071_109870 [Calothrix sp. NIES-4071]BAZ65248.1 hypothetical protein NIES4105_109810 [Calothrix sp. NIES-4105]